MQNIWRRFGFRMFRIQWCQKYSERQFYMSSSTILRRLGRSQECLHRKIFTNSTICSHTLTRRHKIKSSVNFSIARVLKGSSPFQQMLTNTLRLSTKSWLSEYLTIDNSFICFNQIGNQKTEAAGCVFFAKLLFIFLDESLSWVR